MRFKNYFGLDKLNLIEEQQSFTEQYLSGGSNTNKDDGIEEGGAGWRILREQIIYQTSRALRIRTSATLRRTREYVQFMKNTFDETYLKKC